MRADRFHEAGFAVMPGLLSTDDLALARRMASDLVDRHRGGDDDVVATSVSMASLRRQHPARCAGVPASAAMEREPYIIGGLTGLDDRAVRLFANDAFWTGAAALLDCGSDEVVFHLSNLTRKPANIGPAIGWHRDAGNRYFSAEDDRTLRYLMPLQPMSAANGGTSVVRGSHRELTVEGARDGVVEYPAVEPGGGLVLHARTWHGGEGNCSAIDRDVLVVQFGVASSPVRRTPVEERLQMAGRSAFAGAA